MNFHGCTVCSSDVVRAKAKLCFKAVDFMWNGIGECAVLIIW